MTRGLSPPGEAGTSQREEKESKEEKEEEEKEEEEEREKAKEVEEEEDEEGAVSPFEVSSKNNRAMGAHILDKKSRMCAPIVHPLRVLG